MAKRVLKILHLLGSAGLVGALAAHAVLLATLPEDAPESYAAARRSIEALSAWVLVPSLVIALVSGVFAIAIHPPFHNAGWAWAKAVLGFPMFHATLLTLDASAQRASELSARARAGEVDPAVLADLVAHEWSALWMLLGLAVAQTVLGVWRPRRLRRRRR